MLSNPQAVAFYEQKIGGFYDETYRIIANFLVEYAHEHEDFVPVDLISSLETSELPEKDVLINQISTLYLERNHPDKCDESLLVNLQEVINAEKEKIFESDTLEQSLEGKDPKEKARILSDYNRRRLRKKQN